MIMPVLPRNYRREIEPLLFWPWGYPMQFQELVLPSLVRHDPKSLRLQAIICEICGTEAEFDPLEPGDFEHALNTLQHHKCKNQ